MKRQIIRGSGFCAVTEDGLLTEYIPTGVTGQCGDILLGRTGRLMPGLKCAFVDIGRKKSGFLPLDEESGSFTGGKVCSGQMMVLQIKKEENGEKGAYLTRDITLPGQYIILMPMNRYIGVSSRIRDTETRERLKETGIEVAGGRFGLIMRNAAAEADREKIRTETETILAIWMQLTVQAAEGGEPGQILWSSDPVQRIREDYGAGGFQEVTEPDGPGPDIRRQLREADERLLRLPGGGNIVIDRCEAMTVIDVNSASSAGAVSKEQTVTETNLEACEIIARQVRLRNLGGIILVDFIDMEKEKDRSLVLERLTECFGQDRVKTVIHGWTKLGIMEMTRKRTRQELCFSDILTDHNN